MIKESIIKNINGKWYLYSKDGTKKLGGPYNTRAEVINREKQVQYFKHKNAKMELFNHYKFAALPINMNIGWGGSNPGGQAKAKLKKPKFDYYEAHNNSGKSRKWDQLWGDGNNYLNTTNIGMYSKPRTISYKVAENEDIHSKKKKWLKIIMRALAFGLPIASVVGLLALVKPWDDEELPEPSQELPEPSQELPEPSQDDSTGINPVTNNLNTKELANQYTDKIIAAPPSSPDLSDTLGLAGIMASMGNITGKGAIPKTLLRGTVASTLGGFASGLTGNPYGFAAGASLPGAIRAIRSKNLPKFNPRSLGLSVSKSIPNIARSVRGFLPFVAAANTGLEGFNVFTEAKTLSQLTGEPISSSLQKVINAQGKGVNEYYENMNLGKGIRTGLSITENPVLNPHRAFTSGYNTSTTMQEASTAAETALRNYIMYHSPQTYEHSNKSTGLASDDRGEYGSSVQRPVRPLYEAFKGLEDAEQERLVTGLSQASSSNVIPANIKLIRERLMNQIQPDVTKTQFSNILNNLYPERISPLRDNRQRGGMGLYDRMR